MRSDSRPDWLLRALGRIVVVGDVMVDVYLDGVTKGLAREAPIPVVRVQNDAIAPGGAANAAANLAALGADVTLVGAVGDDAWADRLSAALARARVATAFVRTPGRPTTRKVRVRIDDGNLAPRIVFRYDVESDLTVDATAVIAAVDSACDGADALVVSDSGLGVLGDHAIAAINERADRMRVFVDSRRQSLRFRGAAALAPNDEEAAQALGWPVETDDETRRAIAELASRTGSETVLVTRGGRGVAVFGDGRVEILPVARLERGTESAVDTTGAGDSAFAAFVVARLCGAPAVAAADLANLAGAIAVREAGTVAVERRALVDAYLASMTLAHRSAG